MPWLNRFSVQLHCQDRHHSYNTILAHGVLMLATLLAVAGDVDSPMHFATDSCRAASVLAGYAYNSHHTTPY